MTGQGTWDKGHGNGTGRGSWEEGREQNWEGEAIAEPKRQRMASMGGRGSCRAEDGSEWRIAISDWQDLILAHREVRPPKFPDAE